MTNASAQTARSAGRAQSAGAEKTLGVPMKMSGRQTRGRWLTLQGDVGWLELVNCNANGYRLRYNGEMSGVRVAAASCAATGRQVRRCEIGIDKDNANNMPHALQSA